MQKIVKKSKLEKIIITDNNFNKINLKKLKQIIMFQLGYYPHSTLYRLSGFLYGMNENDCIKLKKFLLKEQIKYKDLEKVFIAFVSLKRAKSIEKEEELLEKMKTYDL
nr:hypothetical protein [uncultured Fusobacterium sp.]